MEEAIVEALSAFGLKSFWIEGKTGVWLLDSLGRERKIASLGIAVRKSISYHGMALNVSNDLKPFSLIQPCGFSPSVMTSVSESLGRTVEMSEVAPLLEAALQKRISSSRKLESSDL